MVASGGVPCGGGSGEAEWEEVSRAVEEAGEEACVGDGFGDSGVAFEDHGGFAGEGRAERGGVGEDAVIDEGEAGDERGEGSEGEQAAVFMLIGEAEDGRDEHDGSGVFGGDGEGGGEAEPCGAAWGRQFFQLGGGGEDGADAEEESGILLEVAAVFVDIRLEDEEEAGGESGPWAAVLGDRPREEDGGGGGEGCGEAASGFHDVLGR